MTTFWGRAACSVDPVLTFKDHVTKDDVCYRILDAIGKQDDLLSIV